MKKALLTFACFLMTFSVYAQTLEVTDWYRLNGAENRDRAAEVCFKLTPAPSSLQVIRVKSDYNTNNEGIYYTHIGPEGRACLVVATFSGRVQVEVPGNSLRTQKLSF